MLDHSIFQLKSFHWLRHLGLSAIIPCPTNMVNVRVIFVGHFYFYFSLVFDVFGVVNKTVIPFALVR